MRVPCICTLLCLVGILTVCHAKSLTEKDCGGAASLEDNGQATITFGKGKYPPNKSCDWTIVGDNDCTPEITCPDFEVRKLDGDCDEEYVRITDGVGGEYKICGDGSFTKPKRASGNNRDLYIEIVAGSKANFDKPVKGIKCTAKCSPKKGAGAEQLPNKGLDRKEEFKCVCGLQNKDDRIVGGEDAKLGEFPWQVAIVTPGTRQPMCGGSVINNQYILTAAHCFWFAKMTPDQIEVLIHAQVLDATVTRADASDKIKLGEEGSLQSRGYDFAKKTDADEGTMRFKVVEILNHPLFTSGFDYDAALLKLDRKIPLVGDKAPTPICLPKPGSWHTLFDNDKALVSGWGLGDENAGSTTRLLQKLDVPVIPMQKCKDAMPHDLTDRMLCAGFMGGGKDACTGDSGGPLSIKQANKQWVQIGVVSWGEGCARADRPGLYSRVTEFVQWINYHTSKTAGVTWCRDSKGKR